LRSCKFVQPLDKPDLSAANPAATADRETDPPDHPEVPQRTREDEAGLVATGAALFHAQDRSSCNIMGALLLFSYYFIFDYKYYRNIYYSLYFI